MNKVIDYLKFFKFRYHLSFVLVILGAIFAGGKISWPLIQTLFLVYLSFNVLMYGGLYTLNDIFDLKSDQQHPKKRNRPLPAGRISISAAWAFSIIGILLGLTSGYVYFGKSILVLYIFFILINQFYTHVAKKIPYLEIAINAITYPARFLLGVLLLTNEIPYLILMAVFLLASGVATLRRIVEMNNEGWKARLVLQHYQINTLIILQVVLFVLVLISAFLDYPNSRPWHLTIIAFYLVSVFLIYFSKTIKSFYRWLWLN